MMPLSGRKILITRARHQAATLTTALEEQGAEVLAVPAIEIVPPPSYEPLDAALRNLGRYNWLVLTSVNGVEAMAQRLRILSQKTLLAPAIGLQSSHRVKVAAMGPATARALQAYGIPVDVLPEKYVAESLVEALRGQVFGEDVLLVRAEQARDVVPTELEKAGARVEVVAAYRTVVPESSCVRLREILGGSGPLPNAVTFTSSSTVTNFFRLLAEAGASGWPASVAAASIGPITTRTLMDHGIEPVVEAKEFTIPGLVDALCRWYRR